MSYSKTSGFMDFFSGFKEAGDKYDKENFVIRAEDLKAKRDAIIEMKKGDSDLYYEAFGVRVKPEFKDIPMTTYKKGGLVVNLFKWS